MWEKLNSDGAEALAGVTADSDMNAQFMLREGMKALQAFSDDLNLAAHIANRLVLPFHY